MTTADYPIAIALKAAASTPVPEGQTAAKLMAHGTMPLLYYAPRRALRRRKWRGLQW